MRPSLGNMPVDIVSIIIAMLDVRSVMHMLSLNREFYGLRDIMYRDLEHPSDDDEEEGVMVMHIFFADHRWEEYPIIERIPHLIIDMLVIDVYENIWWSERNPIVGTLTIRTEYQTCDPNGGHTTPFKTCEDWVIPCRPRHLRIGDSFDVVTLPRGYTHVKLINVKSRNLRIRRYQHMFNVVVERRDTNARLVKAFMVMRTRLEQQRIVPVQCPFRDTMIE